MICQKILFRQIKQIPYFSHSSKYSALINSTHKIPFAYKIQNLSFRNFDKNKVIIWIKICSSFIERFTFTNDKNLVAFTNELETLNSIISLTLTHKTLLDDDEIKKNLNEAITSYISQIQRLNSSNRSKYKVYNILGTMYFYTSLFKNVRTTNNLEINNINDLPETEIDMDLDISGESLKNHKTFSNIDGDNKEQVDKKFDNSAEITLKKILEIYENWDKPILSDVIRVCMNVENQKFILKIYHKCISQGEKDIGISDQYFKMGRLFSHKAIEVPDFWDDYESLILNNEIQINTNPLLKAPNLNDIIVCFYRSASGSIKLWKHFLNLTINYIDSFTLIQISKILFQISKIIRQKSKYLDNQSSSKKCIPSIFTPEIKQLLEDKFIQEWNQLITKQDSIVIYDFTMSFFRMESTNPQLWMMIKEIFVEKFELESMRIVSDIAEAVAFGHNLHPISLKVFIKFKLLIIKLSTADQLTKRKDRLDLIFSKLCFFLISSICNQNSLITIDYIDHRLVNALETILDHCIDKFSIILISGMNLMLRTTLTSSLMLTRIEQALIDNLRCLNIKQVHHLITYHLSVKVDISVEWILALEKYFLDKEHSGDFNEHLLLKLLDCIIKSNHKSLNTFNSLFGLYVKYRRNYSIHSNVYILTFFLDKKCKLDSHFKLKCREIFDEILSDELIQKECAELLNNFNNYKIQISKMENVNSDNLDIPSVVYGNKSTLSFIASKSKILKEKSLIDLISKFTLKYLAEIKSINIFSNRDISSISILIHQIATEFPENKALCIEKLQIIANIIILRGAISLKAVKDAIKLIKVFVHYPEILNREALYLIVYESIPNYLQYTSQMAILINLFSEHQIGLESTWNIFERWVIRSANKIYIRYAVNICRCFLKKQSNNYHGVIDILLKTFRENWNKLNLDDVEILLDCFEIIDMRYKDSKWSLNIVSFKQELLESSLNSIIIYESSAKNDNKLIEDDDDLSSEDESEGWQNNIKSQPRRSFKQKEVNFDKNYRGEALDYKFFKPNSFVDYWKL